MKNRIFALAAAFVFAFSASAGAVSPWAAEGVRAAREMGLAPASLGNLEKPITRESLCLLGMNVYETVTGSPYPSEESSFTDTASPYVAAADALGLVKGRGDGVFDPSALVTREEAAVFFVSMAELFDLEPDGESTGFYDRYEISPWAADYVNAASAFGYMTADYKGDFLPAESLSAEQAVLIALRLCRDARPDLAEEAAPTLRGGTGDYVYNGSYRRNSPDDVFTDGEIDSKAEADDQMTEITVDIWELKNGEKVSGKLTLTVHKNLAEVLKDIFAEIYNGPERFPIDPDGTYCYAFRSTAGTNRLSEHATGTAIDINPDQNFCVYSDGSTVGSLYAPGENPYSITKYGDCWNAFVSHGFTWGGDAWNSPRDYMHFSYLGK